MVVGTPDSWDPVTSISGKDDYKFCTWSPCGRFVAALVGNTVEIRNQLTFQLLTTLQPTETTPPLAGLLTYSTDGRSLACSTNTTIVIWDVQTGGVAKEIPRCTDTISLAWSLDGRSITTIHHFSPDTGQTGICLCVYDIASGSPIFVETIHSNHKPHLWAHKTTFRLMTTERHPLNNAEIEIEIRLFEVQSHLTVIQTFSVTVDSQPADTGTDCAPGSEIISFSPTTRHVSVLTGNELLIFPDWVTVPLLRQKGRFLSSCFSADGNFFAAAQENDVYIWKYNPGPGFVFFDPWKKFRCQDSINPPQFSPVPSSALILGFFRNILQVRRLHDLPSDPIVPAQQYAALTRSGSCIATASKGHGQVAITGPHSRSPLQLIYTGVPIAGLVITGNVLLVLGPDKVLSWWLTEEGLVHDHQSSRRWPDSRRCIWIMPLPLPRRSLEFRVEGQIGAIKHDGNVFLYHTATGDVLQPALVPLHLNHPGENLGDGLCGRHYLHYHNVSQQSTTPGRGWHPSEAALQEGWVKDPKGRYRLWLPVEWRKSWDVADWRYDVTTQFSSIRGCPLITKF